MEFSRTTQRLTLVADRASIAIAPQGWQVQQLSMADAPAVLEGQQDHGLLVAEVERCDAAEEHVLGLIDLFSRSRSRAAVVVFPPHLLDPVAALITSPDITLLCDPSPAERIAAVAFAAERGALSLRETRDAESAGLQSLADEVARIARALAALASDAPRPGGDVFSDGLVGYRAEAAPSLPADSTPVSAGEVRALIRARRLRDRYLPPDLFGEPAWDMLLDLLAARIERTRVAVSSLCIAAAVPPTTALRMVRTMTERGLFRRIDDPNDRRRVFIELSEASARAMLEYVAAARAI